MYLLYLLYLLYCYIYIFLLLYTLLLERINIMEELVVEIENLEASGKWVVLFKKGKYPQMSPESCPTLADALKAATDIVIARFQNTVDKEIVIRIKR